MLFIAYVILKIEPRMIGISLSGLTIVVVLFFVVLINETFNDRVTVSVRLIRFLTVSFSSLMISNTSSTTCRGMK